MGTLIDCQDLLKKLGYLGCRWCSYLNTPGPTTFVQFSNRSPAAKCQWDWEKLYIS